ncbi:FxsC protein [Streptomyces griseorubiginosus]|uniref:FxsC protein n=1 Tax=Streptomyces griseorubiginosus TaxID=67304 RepID=UPI002E80ECD3|nr:FxsC protein [Streptomyces griseorubiginosus]WUB45867.1 FxsC protein [Streptomyces griseorubiginosus]
MSHFYLSHVRTVDEEWVAAFFHDLCRAVAQRTGRSPEAVGVRGKPQSSDVSVDLLGRSTVLVVLHSPRYFSQSYCRAELSYFQRRLNMQRSRTGRSADAVVPVMWEPDFTHPLESVVPYPPLGPRSEAYRRDGLLHLLRLKARYRSEYEEVLTAVADRIVAAAEQLPEVHGFDASGSHSPVGAPQPVGSQEVSFVVASSAKEDVPGERHSRQYYGKTVLDWSPYAPGEHEALVALVKNTATALDFTANVLPLDEESVDRIVREQDPEQLVVLLVDAWVALRREEHRLLAAVDERNPEATTALEPRARDDTESAEWAGTLDELLDRTLPRMRGRHSEYERWRLLDAESFTSSLRKVLIRLQNEALKSVEAVQSPATPTEGLHTFPLLGRYSS